MKIIIGYWDIFFKLTDIGNSLPKNHYDIEFISLV